MGSFRFSLPESNQVVVDRPELIYMAGLDGIPLKITRHVEGRLLTIEREDDDSGKLFAPIQRSCGRVVLVPTGTVVVREKPYRLLLELARGAVDRLRNQHDLWIRCGFEFSDDIAEKIHGVSQSFCRAAVRQNEADACDQHAAEVLEESLQVIDQLEEEYADQVIALRHQQPDAVSTLYGTRLPDVGPSAPASPSLAEAALDQYPDAFDTVYLEVNWSQYEPEVDQLDLAPLINRVRRFRDKGYRVAVGPMIRVDEQLLPKFIMDATDFEFVRGRFAKFAEKVTRAVGNEVDLLDVFGGLNSKVDLELPIDYRLRLAIDAIEAAQGVNPESPLIIGFDQPWCEGAERELCLSPLQCADAIVRANLQIAGFLLEVNWGITPAGTTPRDVLQLHTMLDLWSQFELPLVISLAIPSRCDADPAARFDDGCVAQCDADKAAEQQACELRSLVQFLLAKPIVQGIIWNQLHDGNRHRFRHCGLLNPDGTPKPAFQTWRQLRPNWQK